MGQRWRDGNKNNGTSILANWLLFLGIFNLVGNTSGMVSPCRKGWSTDPGTLFPDLKGNHGKSTSEIPFLLFGAKKRCFPAFSFPSIHWIRRQFMGRPSLRLSGSLSEFDQSTIVARRESLGQWIYPDFIRWKMPYMPDVSRFPCFLRFLRRIYNDIDN